MKIIKKLCLAVILLMGVIVSLSSCSKDDDSVEGDGIVGTWKMSDEETVEYITFFDDGVAYEYNYCNKHKEWENCDDFKYAYDESTQVLHKSYGTFTSKEKVISLTSKQLVFEGVKTNEYYTRTKAPLTRKQLEDLD